MNHHIPRMSVIAFLAPISYNGNMKTIRILTVFFVLFTGLASGQIPNSGFEEWINAGTHLNPAGWWTTNELVTSGSYYPVSVSSDHYPPGIGTFSMRLENNPALLPDWAAFGIAWTGNINGSDRPVFPVQGHPTSLWGYYKFLPENGDTMEIHARLYFHGIDISGGSFKTAKTTDMWTAFSLELSEYTVADSARIFLSACYDNDEPSPHGNSILYIDNLSFDSLVTTRTDDLSDRKDVIVYPNPASDYLVVEMPVSRDLPVLNVELINSSGMLSLAKDKADNTGQLKLDLSSLSSGVYCMRITQGEQVMLKKIVVLR